MSDTFNGYHVWLGIPPAEQPTNHYRLLGITLFETDLDVIDHAADRQMAHVRTFQAGRHGALSQQILNELAGARLCLLSPERKATYDEQLRRKLGTVAAPTAATPPSAATPPTLPAGRIGATAVMPVGKPIPVAQPVAKAIPRAAPVTKSRVPSPDDDDAPYEVEHEGAFHMQDLSAELAQENLAFPSYGRRYPALDGSWRRPAALGLIAAVIFVGFMLTYYLVRGITASPDWNWRKLVPAHPAASAAAEAESGAEPGHSILPPAAPPPAPETGP